MQAGQIGMQHSSLEHFASRKRYKKATSFLLLSLLQTSTHFLKPKGLKINHHYLPGQIQDVLVHGILYQSFLSCSTGGDS